jgi:hypothetical protein
MGKRSHRIESDLNDNSESEAENVIDKLLESN